MVNGKWKMGGMEKARDIPTRAFEFATRIVRLGRFLYRKGDVPRRLIDQLVACGTSIGANIEEGQAAQSKPDFIAKYGIALREARESAYRLRLFVAGEILTNKQADELYKEAEELKRMIGQAVVTARKNHEKAERTK
jgi:four helix bundle protein